MIWFGNLNHLVAVSDPDAFGPVPEERRMLRALQVVAERAPQLSGGALIQALAATGWVDEPTARRLLPTFREFDPDRHFSEYLRALSFRGRAAAGEFRTGVRCIVRELTGDGEVVDFGREPVIRFRTGSREGVVLAQPQVAFSISGPTFDAVRAAAAEMPDAVVVVARNFDAGAPAQLASVLAGTGVPGTLVTVNLLLGLRAMKLRYRPSEEKVVRLLGSGRPLRSADIATLA